MRHCRRPFIDRLSEPDKYRASSFGNGALEIKQPRERSDKTVGSLYRAFRRPGADRILTQGRWGPVEQEVMHAEAITTHGSDADRASSSSSTTIGNKTVAIVQSNYIPWKGYFDLIGLADEFILFDDVQYTRRDWRNRNRIKGPSGPIWLTIPVQVKGKYHQKIKETVIGDPAWNRRHWKTLAHNYTQTRHFAEFRPVLEELYLGSSERSLSRVNHRFITAICRMLSIDTTISWSMDYDLAEGKTERLVSLCRGAGATEYISGPAARVYLDESLFRQEGIAVRWMDYSGYPPYRQLYPPFEHHVSIVDLILNEGRDARRYMKCSTAEAPARDQAPEMGIGRAREAACSHTRSSGREDSF